MLLRSRPTARGAVAPSNQNQWRRRRAWKGIGMHFQGRLPQTFVILHISAHSAGAASSSARSALKRSGGLEHPCKSQCTRRFPSRSIGLDLAVKFVCSERRMERGRLHGLCMVPGCTECARIPLFDDEIDAQCDHYEALVKQGTIWFAANRYYEQVWCTLYRHCIMLF